MALESMNDVRKSAKKMESLFADNNYELAAREGMQIIGAFTHHALIEREAYKVCFNEMSQEDFYKHVVKQAKIIVERFNS